MRLIDIIVLCFLLSCGLIGMTVWLWNEIKPPKPETYAERIDRLERECEIGPYNPDYVPAIAVEVAQRRDSDYYDFSGKLRPYDHWQDMCAKEQQEKQKRAKVYARSLPLPCCTLSHNPSEPTHSGERITNV